MIDLLEQAAPKAKTLERNFLLSPTPAQQKAKKDDRSIQTTTLHLFEYTLKNIVSKNWDILGKRHTTSPLYEWYTHAS